MAGRRVPVAVLLRTAGVLMGATTPSRAGVLVRATATNPSPWSGKAGSRTYTTYTRAKFGGVKAKFGGFKDYVQKQWDGLDASIRQTIVEFITKSALVVMSGGGGAYLMKYTIDRLAEVEKRVDKAELELQDLKNLFLLEAHFSDYRFKRSHEATSDKFLKIMCDINQLKFLRDIYLSSLYAEDIAMKASLCEVAKKEDQDSSHCISDDGSANDDAVMINDYSKKGKKEATDGSSHDASPYDDQFEGLLNAIFEMMDKDRGGFISMAELVELLNKWNPKSAANSKGKDE